VRQEQGRLDLLVNNAWGGYERYDPAAFQLPFWEQPAEYWKRMITAGVRTHYVAARLAAPMMIEQRRGLIVGTGFGDRGKYLGNLVYDVAKAAVIRLAWGMAQELRDHGVAAVSLHPGFTRTEKVLDGYGGDLGPTNSPQYVGRAIAVLAADPSVLEKSGQELRVGDVAAEYGFTDVDGRFVPPFELSGET
jgi:NAD(P)-dependent dehydrogenase (short-subunit alcohol dehydrogenase family)